jgi:hypothetical protein
VGYVFRSAFMTNRGRSHADCRPPILNDDVHVRWILPYITLVATLVMLVLSAPFRPKDMNEEETG